MKLHPVPLTFALAGTLLSALPGICETASPPPLPGFIHTETLSNDTDQLHGIITELAPPTYSSPVIAEIDGITTNGLEIAIAGSDGQIATYHSDGTLLWRVSAPHVSCPGLRANNRLHSSPAVGALYGDGVPYVVVGYGGFTNSSCDGGIVAYRGSTGAQAWNFSIQKFERKQRFSERFQAVFSTPALADTDGDGKLEIGFGGFDRHVYLLNANGTARWYYQAADTVWSSPAFADVDGDGVLEMIIGTDISANRQLRPPTHNGGYLYAFKTKKRRPILARFRDQSLYLWQTPMEQVVYASPVVADVMESSAGAEVVVGSGCFFPQGSSQKKGAWFKVLRARDGEVLRTLDVTSCSTSSPAAADIDSDGDLEIVVTVSGDTASGGDGYGRVMAFDPDDSSLLWSTIPYERGRNDPLTGFFSSPVIADLDGNGSLEVAIAQSTGIVLLDARTGGQLTCSERGCDSGLPALIASSGPLRSTPAIGDLNNDGILDLISFGNHPGKRRFGALFGWTNFSSVALSTPGNGPSFDVPWPMFRRDAQRAATR